MKLLPGLWLILALLPSASAHADCTLAFAPPEVRRAASEHYYASAKRDAPAPGRVPVATRPAGRACDAMPQDSHGVSPTCARTQSVMPDASILDVRSED